MTLVEGITCTVCGVFSPGKHERCPKCPPSPPPPPPPRVRCTGYAAELGSPVLLHRADGSVYGHALCRCINLNCVQRAPYATVQCAAPAARSAQVDALMADFGTSVRTRAERNSERNSELEKAENEPKKKFKRVPMDSSSSSSGCCASLCRTLFYLSCIYVAGFILTALLSLNAPRVDKVGLNLTTTAPSSLLSPSSPLEQPILYGSCVILPKPHVRYAPFNVTHAAYRLYFDPHHGLDVVAVNAPPRGKRLENALHGFWRSNLGGWFTGGKLWYTDVSAYEKNAICLDATGQLSYATIELPLKYPAPAIVWRGTCAHLVLEGVEYGPFELRNTNGYSASFQRDGNVVIYDPKGMATWASRTAGTKGGMMRKAGDWLVGTHSFAAFSDKKESWADMLCLNPDNTLSFTSNMSATATLAATRAPSPSASSSSSSSPNCVDIVPGSPLKTFHLRSLNHYHTATFAAGSHLKVRYHDHVAWSSMHVYSDISYDGKDLVYTLTHGKDIRIREPAPNARALCIRDNGDFVYEKKDGSRLAAHAWGRDLSG